MGLSAEEMRALDALSLEQLLESLKPAHLQNRQPKSKYKGVTQTNGTWRARLCRVTGQRSAVCDSEEEAARAYDRLALEQLGR